MPDFDLPPVAIKFLRDSVKLSYRDIAKQVRCDHTTVFRAYTLGSNTRLYTRERLRRLASAHWKKGVR